MKNDIPFYWDDIPYGKENAISYDELCRIWNCSERIARRILHELSCSDDGSDMVLIRSGSGKGFYKTDDIETIKAFRNECLEKGRSIFAPLRKINRIMRTEASQYELENNLRLIRNSRKLSLSDVVKKMKKYDPAFDKPMLSKMENNICLPTPFQLAILSEIYGVKTDELINVDLFI